MKETKKCELSELVFCATVSTFGRNSVWLFLYVG